MKPVGATSLPGEQVGQVKNGLVVLDTPVHLTEGQAVRVEPIGDQMETQADFNRADRVRQLQELFAEWTEEDGKLSDE